MVSDPSLEQGINQVTFIEECAWKEMLYGTLLKRPTRESQYKSHQVSPYGIASASPSPPPYSFQVEQVFLKMYHGPCQI